MNEYREMTQLEKVRMTGQRSPEDQAAWCDRNAMPYCKQVRCGRITFCAIQYDRAEAMQPFLDWDAIKDASVGSGCYLAAS